MSARSDINAAVGQAVQVSSTLANREGASPDMQELLGAVPVSSLIQGSRLQISQQPSMTDVTGYSPAKQIVPMPSPESKNAALGSMVTKQPDTEQQHPQLVMGT